MLRHVSLGLLTLSLAACSGGLDVQDISAQAPQQAAQVRPGPTSSVSAYRLGIGDRVKLVVFGEDPLSGEFEVDGAGNVTVPLIGALHAQDLTLAELQEALLTRFKAGFLRSPKLSVEIISYRPVFILGEVKNSGEYKFRPGLTALEVVAMAGGFTYRADTNRVYVRRRGSQDEQVFRINDQVHVFPGDNLRIGERYF